ncbi:hypothetical protein BDL97_07G024500 [Sphagnum fallax]|nr:hypothetical protein BDL97_07G024500 [Sphagnum fallax]
MADQLDLDFRLWTNERYPDFKPNNTWEALWVEDRRNSPWVAADIAAKAAYIVQFNIFGCNRNLTKHACAPLRTLEDGRLVHKQLIQTGCESDAFVGSSLVGMYAKCGSIEDAWRVFNKMPSENVVTWSTMILGHVQCGQGQKALGQFQEMKQEGVDPNSVTFVGVLNACATVLGLEEGRCVHQEVIQTGLELDVFVGSSLVDIVFNKTPFRNVVTRSTILGGCAMHGHEGVQPDDTTFIHLLSACCHAGLLEHYTCRVDLLGHAGHLQEVENMVMAMPWKPHVSAWMALLGACRIHRNVEMGECVARRILEMEPDNAADYGLASNICAAAGNRHLCENLKYYCIHTALQRLSGLMHDVGYVPCTRFVLHVVEEEELVFQLCHLSEKLAIALGSSTQLLVVLSK